MLHKQIALVIFCILLLGCSGTRPQNLGVVDGVLSPCPSSPNCVSSQSQDESHWIAALDYTRTKVEAMQHLKAVVEAQPRAKVVSQTDEYLYAEFSSAFWKFVDDVEFYISDAEKKIHVRSASRLGHSDLGVNRKRIEKIRLVFQQ